MHLTFVSQIIDPFEDGKNEI